MTKKIIHAILVLGFAFYIIQLIPHGVKSQESTCDDGRPLEAFSSPEPGDAAWLCSCQNNSSNTGCVDSCLCRCGGHYCKWYSTSKECRCESTFSEVPPSPFQQVCGNGIVEVGEACDGQAGCTSTEMCDPNCNCLAISASPPPA